VRIRAPRRALGPRCELGKPVDVMGYHDGRDLPNYWAYARNFVLQDHMFEPNYGWSLPAHLFQVSAWSARCARLTTP
jgi:phospholipase C